MLSPELSPKCLHTSPRVSCQPQHLSMRVWIMKSAYACRWTQSWCMPMPRRERLGPWRSSSAAATKPTCRAWETAASTRACTMLPASCFSTSPTGAAWPPPLSSCTFSSRLWMLPAKPTLPVPGKRSVSTTSRLLRDKYQYFGKSLHVEHVDRHLASLHACHAKHSVYGLLPAKHLFTTSLDLFRHGMGVWRNLDTSLPTLSPCISSLSQNPATLR